MSLASKRIKKTDNAFALPPEKRKKMADNARALSAGRTLRGLGEGYLCAALQIYTVWFVTGGCYRLAGERSLIFGHCRSALTMFPGMSFFQV